MTWNGPSTARHRVLCEVLAGTDLSVDTFIRDIETGMEPNAFWKSPPKPVNER